MHHLVLLLLAAPATGLKVPDGFEASLVAGSDIVNDIHCMTVVPDGRIVVSGRGYVRLLDANGKKLLDFAGAPKDGAMGLFWEKGDLYCVGDGGLKVWRDVEKAHEKPPTVLFKCRTGGEHTAHAVQRGPDGWMYLIVGDGTGITAKDVTGKLSPVKDPIAGCVLRFSPDWKQVECHSHGFRNAYGMDFGCDGELYTFDSDNERCRDLPWYEGCRFYRVQTGGFHGWLGPRLAATWRMPPHFPDVVPPVKDLGRGSPTGVACYRHAQFPEKYRGGFFLCDWTFGVVHFVQRPSEWQGVTSSFPDPKPFVKATGDEGFAPVAAVVDPKTGDLVIAIGGRGTRGAVYRIRYKDGFGKADAKEVQKLQPKPRTLEWDPAYLKRLEGWYVSEGRRRQQEYYLRHMDRLTLEQRKRAYRHGANMFGIVRWMSSRILAATPEAERKAIVTKDPGEWELGTEHHAFPSWEASKVVARARVNADVRLDALRILQIKLGGPPAASARGTVWEGYTRSGKDAIPDAVRADLRKAFPSGETLLDYELARILAMIEDDSPAVLKAMKEKVELPHWMPYHHIHYLACFARLSGKRTREMTEAVADCLVKLDETFTRRDTNWTPRVAEIHAALARHDPALNAAVAERMRRPAQAFLTRAPGFDRQKGARHILEYVERNSHLYSTFDAEMVRLVGELPADESLPVLRGLWGKYGLEEQIVPALARHARAEDHTRLLVGVGSARPAVVVAALAGLEKLPVKDKAEAEALIVAARLLPADKASEPLRKRLLARLKKATGHEEKSLDGWAIWASEKWPALARKLNSPDGVDVSAWDRRLARIDWDKGDAKRGAGVFTRASCANCHSGTAALGPDLAGVAGRFSRADLFTAIIRPSKDVAERYRMTQYTTEAGKVYQGIVAYEAIDSVILLTGPAETVRIANKQIASKRLTALSLMPTGLIDRLTDVEIADLYAHLRARK